MSEFLNLIRCVRCLEHLSYNQSRFTSDYNKMYNKIVNILEEKTNLSINELYRQIRDIKANEETNALEALGFFNRFIDENRARMDVKERQHYQKIMYPLTSGMWLNSELSYCEMCELGDKLIKKYETS